MENRTLPASPVEAAFRHAKWAEAREVVRGALAASGVTQGRLERFDGCGSQCRVEHSKELDRYRVKAFYCGDRFCIPCMAARGKKVQSAMVEWCKGQTVRFITLTVKEVEGSLNSTMDHLLDSFRRLRHSKLWVNSVRGGTAVVEVTRGKDGSHWHVHLHVLAVGTWLDQSQLSEAWKVASRGSFIVHVRAVPDHSRAASYVAGYATKGWSDSMLADQDALIECITALRGRRLLCNFGDWYNREWDVERVVATDWRVVTYLGHLYEDSISGKPWAAGLCRALRIACGSVNGRPVFIYPEQDWSGP